jgi:hypothetical protein
MKISYTKEQLPLALKEALFNNPLLQRIEDQCRILGWNDEQIRTMQLLVVVASNQSLQRELNNKILQRECK